LSLSQNPVVPKYAVLGRGFGETVQKTGFSVIFKVAFPKTEVLEKPELSTIYN